MWSAKCKHSYQHTGSTICSWYHFKHPYNLSRIRCRLQLRIWVTVLNKANKKLFYKENLQKTQQSKSIQCHSWSTSMAKSPFTNCNHEANTKKDLDPEHLVVCSACKFIFYFEVAKLKAQTPYSLNSCCGLGGPPSSLNLDWKGQTNHLRNFGHQILFTLEGLVFLFRLWVGGLVILLLRLLFLCKIMGLLHLWGVRRSFDFIVGFHCCVR